MSSAQLERLAPERRTFMYAAQWANHFYLVNKRFPDLKEIRDHFKEYQKERT